MPNYNLQRGFRSVSIFRQMMRKVCRSSEVKWFHGKLSPLLFTNCNQLQKYQFYLLSNFSCPFFYLVVELEYDHLFQFQTVDWMKQKNRFKMEFCFRTYFTTILDELWGLKINVTHLRTGGTTFFASKFFTMCFLLHFGPATRRGPNPFKAAFNFYSLNGVAWYATEYYVQVPISIFPSIVNTS